MPHLTPVWSEKILLGCLSYFKFIKNFQCLACDLSWRRLQARLRNQCISLLLGGSLCVRSVRASGLIAVFKSHVSFQSIYSLCHLPGKHDLNQLCKFRCNCCSICYAPQFCQPSLRDFRAVLRRTRIPHCSLPRCVITSSLGSISLGLWWCLLSCRLFCLTSV